MSAPDDAMTDDQATDALLDALAEQRRDPCEELLERLRALVKQWRERADEAAASSDGDDTAEATYYHRYACADELERAIGGGE